MVLLGKLMILQGVGHPISCLGVCYANDPQKGGYTTPAPALDLTTSLRGDSAPLALTLSPKISHRRKTGLKTLGGLEGGGKGGGGLEFEHAAPLEPCSVESATRCTKKVCVAPPRTRQRVVAGKINRI